MVAPTSFAVSRYNGKTVTTESGYEYKDIEIVEEEAKIVRRIFREVAEGRAYTEIARGLNREKIPAPVTSAVKARKKNPKKGQLNSDLEDGWTGRNIAQIVQSERYTGAVLIQKVFTPDYLTHEVRQNKGEVPQYFVRNHHPAIIDEDLFEEAQVIRKENSASYGRENEERKARAFSQRLICGECGRFFHVTNTNNNPIWRCPTSRQTTGKRICRAEKVYEEQVIRAFRKAILERFRLTIKPIHDNVAVADIMSGRFKDGYDNFTPEADSFVGQMLARLESIQKLDFMERDRAFYKKQIVSAHNSAESTSKKIRLLKSQVDVMQTRLELLGDEMIDPVSIEEKKKLIKKLEQSIQNDEETERKLTEQLDYMESYWDELEDDYERREKAIEWMKNLPAGKEGTIAFLNGVTEEHCKAFVLSITIHSPLKYTVHWFDDTKTEVQMDSNIEDYRHQYGLERKYCSRACAKFAADVHDQKSFKNRGEKPQSHYRDDHEAIIERNDFLAVQRIMNNAKFGGTSLLPELQVIPDGLLKGFVIVHPKWGSFTKEDYITACKSVDSDPADESRLEEREGSFDLTGYEVADFKLFSDQSVPAIMLHKDSIAFSVAGIREMNLKDNYVELLVHPLRKEIAVRPTAIVVRQPHRRSFSERWTLRNKT